MSLTIKRLFFWIWPPYEAKIADREIAKRHSAVTDETRWESILIEIRNSLPKDANYEELEAMAKEVQGAEDKRGETIENKAASFASSIGIALAIVSVVSTLLSSGQIPMALLVIPGFMYLLAVICLAVAAHYAVKVRSLVRFASLSADAFVDSMKDNQWKIEDRIVLTIARAKWNEDLLLRKSNYLTVAEMLFLRGLYLIALIAILITAIKLLVR
jgi:hypothetical protein